MATPLMPRVRKGKKRAPDPEIDLDEETSKREKNVKLVRALGEQDASVRLLEDLVFGAEDELVKRLEVIQLFSKVLYVTFGIC